MTLPPVSSSDYAEYLYNKRKKELDASRASPVAEPPPTPTPTPTPVQAPLVSPLNTPTPDFMGAPAPVEEPPPLRTPTPEPLVSPLNAQARTRGISPDPGAYDRQMAPEPPLTSPLNALAVDPAPPAPTATPTPGPPTRPDGSLDYDALLPTVDPTPTPTSTPIPAATAGAAPTRPDGSLDYDALSAQIVAGRNAPEESVQPVPAPTPVAQTSTRGTRPVERGGDLRAYARQAAERNGVDPDVFERQIGQESHFDPTARSGAGAKGIAQIVEKYHPGVDTSDPYASLDYAAKLMAGHLRQYGSMEEALVAYNGGQGAVDARRAGRPYRETQAYLSAILGGSGAGSRTATATPLAGEEQTSGARPGSTATPDQFNSGLSTAEAWAACGPAAAVAFAQRFGRNPSMTEAVALAKQTGWTPEGGMNGVANQAALLGSMGVKSRLETTPDHAAIVSDATDGNPVIVSTAIHYYFADGYDQNTGKLHVGVTGTNRRGGAEWMSLEEITRLDGGINGALFVDPSAGAPTRTNYSQERGAPYPGALPTPYGAGAAAPLGGGREPEPPFIPGDNPDESIFSRIGRIGQGMVESAVGAVRPALVGLATGFGAEGDRSRPGEGDSPSAKLARGEGLASWEVEALSPAERAVYARRNKTGVLHKESLGEGVMDTLSAAGDPQQALFAIWNASMQPNPQEAIAKELRGFRPDYPGQMEPDRRQDPIVFSDILRSYGMEPGRTRDILGRVGDFTLDPLNFTPIGVAGRAGRGATAARVVAEGLATGATAAAGSYAAETAVGGVATGLAVMPEEQRENTIRMNAEAAARAALSAIPGAQALAGPVQTAIESVLRAAAANPQAAKTVANVTGALTGGFGAFAPVRGATLADAAETGINRGAAAIRDSASSPGMTTRIVGSAADAANTSGEVFTPARRPLSPNDPRSTGPTPSDPGYIYHSTNEESARAIADEGLDVFDPSHGTDQDAWPDGSEELRSYWAPKANSAWDFSSGEPGQEVMLRTRADPARFRSERGTGDIYATEPVHAQQLEVLGADGEWRPLDQAFREPGPTVGAGSQPPGWEPTRPEGPLVGRRRVDAANAVLQPEHITDPKQAAVWEFVQNNPHATGQDIAAVFPDYKGNLKGPEGLASLDDQRRLADIGVRLGYHRWYDEVGDAGRDIPAVGVDNLDEYSATAAMTSAKTKFSSNLNQSMRAILAHRIMEKHGLWGQPDEELVYGKLFLGKPDELATLKGRIPDEALGHAAQQMGTPMRSGADVKNLFNLYKTGFNVVKSGAKTTMFSGDIASGGRRQFTLGSTVDRHDVRGFGVASITDELQQSAQVEWDSGLRYTPSMAAADTKQDESVEKYLKLQEAGDQAALDKFVKSQKKRNPDWKPTPAVPQAPALREMFSKIGEGLVVPERSYPLLSTINDALAHERGMNGREFQASKWGVLLQAYEKDPDGMLAWFLGRGTLDEVIDAVEPTLDDTFVAGAAVARDTPENIEMRRRLANYADVPTPAGAGLPMTMNYPGKGAAGEFAQDTASRTAEGRRLGEEYMPRLSISTTTNPAALERLGFDLTEKRTLHDNWLKRDDVFDQKTGKFLAFDDLGVEHDVVITEKLSSYEGATEPSVLFRIYGDRSTARFAGSLAGEALDQDGAGIVVPNSRSKTMGGLTLAEPGRAYTQADQAKLGEFNTHGLDIDFHPDGRIIFVDYDQPNKRRQDVEAWKRQVIDTVDRAGYSPDSLFGFKGESEFVGRGDYSAHIEASGNLHATGGRRDLQGWRDHLAATYQEEVGRITAARPAVTDEPSLGVAAGISRGLPDLGRTPGTGILGGATRETAGAVAGAGYQAAQGKQEGETDADYLARIGKGGLGGAGLAALTRSGVRSGIAQAVAPTEVGASRKRILPPPGPERVADNRARLLERRLERAAGTPEQRAQLRPEQEGEAGNSLLSKLRHPETRILYADAMDDTNLAAGQRRGVVRDVDRNNAAVEMALGRPVEEWLKTKPGKAFTDTEAVAIGMKIDGSAKELRAAQKRYAAVPERERTQAMDEKLALQSMEFALLASVRSGAEAEAGRAVRAFRQVVTAPIGGASGMTDKLKNEMIGKALDTMAPGGFNSWVKEWSLVEGMESTGKLTEAQANRGRYLLARKLVNPTAWDKIDTWRYASMLSNWHTHITNLAGNTTESFARPLEVAVAGIGPGGAGHRKAALEDVKAMYRAIPDAWAMAGEAFRTGATEAAVSGTSKLEGVRPRAFGEGVFGTGNKVDVAAGRAIHFPLDLLTASDEFFRAINKAGALQSRAWRMAKGDAAAYGKLMKEMPDELVEAAHQDALKATFQNDPGALVEQLAKARYGREGIRGPAGIVLGFVLPFVKTPANIFARGTGMLVRGTGLGLVEAAYYAKKGDSDKARLTVAKTAIGAAFGGAIALAAVNGQITGSGPKDASKRRALEESGWQANSIKIGDRWIDYTNLGPVAIEMAVIANAVEGYEEPKKEGEAWHEDVARRIGGTILNVSYLRGLSDLVRGLQEGGAIRAAGQTATSVAGSAVPFGGTLAGIERLLNPEQTVRDSMIQSVAGRIPGASELLDTQPGVFGKPVVRGRETEPLGVLMNMLLPRSSRERTDDPVITEVARLTGAGLSTGVRTVKREYAGVNQTPEKQRELQKSLGQAAYTYLASRVADPKYQALPDARKAEDLQDAVSVAYAITDRKVGESVPRDERSMALLAWQGVPQYEGVKGTVEEIREENFRIARAKAKVAAYAKEMKGDYDAARSRLFKENKAESKLAAMSKIPAASLAKKKDQIDKRYNGALTNLEKGGIAGTAQTVLPDD